MTVGGGSADRKAEELGSAGDAAAGAWAAGAEGERRVAEELSNLREAWTVLHDRLLRPGQSEANLDHVVIGPGGLFLVDAKNRAGRVSEWEGGLFQHVTRDGVRQSVNLAAELKKVHGMAAYMAVESDRPVTPVLCLAGSQEAEFGEPQMVQGVWVVPMSKVVNWLNSRPVVLDRESAGRAVTRAMTDFPSTTTDHELLAAIGHAAAEEKQARRHLQRGTSRGAGGRRRPGRVSASRRPRRRSFAARLARAIAGLLMMVVSFSLLMAVIPPLLTAGVNSLADTADPDSGSGAPTSPAPTPKPSTKPTAKASPKVKTTKAPMPKPQPKPPAPALAPMDCARVTGPEVAKILGRRVQPIAVRTGCAWGTRLDDASTTLVSISMSAGHAVYDSQFQTSVMQRRVVYGTAYGPNYRPATALWVATGQPIRVGNRRTAALADTHVIVSSHELGLTDDQARARALSIAMAAFN